MLPLAAKSSSSDEQTRKIGRHLPPDESGAASPETFTGAVPDCADSGNAPSSIGTEEGLHDNPLTRSILERERMLTREAELRLDVAAAEGNAITGLIAEENFVGGKMFWREPIDYAQALVLYNNGTWKIYEHPPYVEGSPEYACIDEHTPAQSPPTPRRGFGTMWCDIPDIRQGLGNATDVERGYTGTMQTFDHGFMILTDYNTMFVFYNDGTWEQR